MLPETNEPQTTLEYSPDLFAEPHDHANQWDVSAFWPEADRQSTEEEKTPKAE
jgi:hypothetical protein